MDIDKVRALNDTELAEELTTQRRHLYDLRFQLATRQLTDYTQLTGTRRTIARVLTVMTERGIDENTIVRPRPSPAPRRRAASGRRTKAQTAEARGATRGATGGKKE